MGGFESFIKTRCVHLLQRDPDTDDEGFGSPTSSPMSKHQQDGGEYEKNEQAKIDACRARPRRPSVSGGTVSKEDRKNYVKPVHEKSEAAKAKIANAINTN